MSKDPLEKVGDAIKKTGEDIHDSLSEAGHRSAAEEERAKRDVLGSEMTPGEKVASGFNEGKHRVEADIDEAKRKLRDRT